MATRLTLRTFKHKKRKVTNVLQLADSSYGDNISVMKLYRGCPCYGLAAIFAGMLYTVQIIQKSRTRNIMHVNIIILKLPAKLHEVID